MTAVAAAPAITCSPPINGKKVVPEDAALPTASEVNIPRASGQKAMPRRAILSGESRTVSGPS
ncbi:MAG: hypothetical protein ACREFP_14365 [Acetobacteraceae bacterium]